MSRLRTFIAVDPGKAIRERLVALQENLARAGSEMKWVEPENLHVTLLFLGEVDNREVPDVCRVDRREEPSEMGELTGRPADPRTGQGGQESFEVGDHGPTQSLVDAFEMTVGGVGCFGSPRRPRTVWAGLSDGEPEMVALHDALEPPLLGLGCYRREGRPFTAHITLGRVKGERADDSLAAALPKYATWEGGTVEVREVLVMSSELSPAGPLYTVLSRAKLRRTKE